jgi:hypothetical protein
MFTRPVVNIPKVVADASRRKDSVGISDNLFEIQAG